MTSQTTTCPRCAGTIPFGDRNHSIGQCDRTGQYKNPNPGFVKAKLWPGCDAVGQPSNTINDIIECDDLLKAFTADQKLQQFNGDQITKQMLENAWQKVYEGKSGKNQADIERTKRQKNESKAAQMPIRGHQPGPSSAPKSAWSKPLHGVGKGASQTVTLKQTGISNASGPNGKRNFMITGHPEENRRYSPAPNYEFAVHKDCNHDNSLLAEPHDARRIGTGTRFNVAVNYVAVSKTPEKVYMYGITYGTITAVKSKKEEQENQDAAKGVQQSGQQTDGTDAGTGEKEQGRKVGQRNEKARIFKALADRSPLSNVPWATDYEFLWTLEPIPEHELISTNVIYAKLSGREYKLDTIDFGYLRKLDLGNDRDEASQSLLNQADVTKKGGSLRISALNALITKHVSSSSNNIFQVGPNKFFLKSGFDSDTQLFDIHRGYFSSIRPGANSVLLNINVATAAFYKSMNVAKFYVLVRDHFSGVYGSPEDLLKGLTVRIAYGRQKHDGEDYDPNVEQHRHRTIAGFGGAPDEEKFDHNGVTKTVQSYFENDLGAVISYPKLPCISINVAPPKKTTDAEGDDTASSSKTSKGGQKSQGKKPGGKQLAEKDDKHEKKQVKPNWVPPEFLQIDPYQAFKKLLSGADTDNMLSVALRHPAKNQNLIISEAFPLLGLDQQNAGFTKLGLTVGQELLAVPARQLQPPNIMYRSIVGGGGGRGGRGGRGGFGPRGGRGGRGGFIPRGGMSQQAGGNTQRGHQAPTAPATAAKVDNASWNVREVHFFQPPPAMPNKAVCTIDMRKYRKTNDDLTGIGLQLSNTLRNHGVLFTQAPAAMYGYRDTYRTLAAVNAFDDIAIYNALEADLEALGSPDMLVILLSEKDTDLYGGVKRVCDQWLGVHTVCLTVDKLFKPGYPDRSIIEYHPPPPQLLSNLALKLNMKLRGQNHQICLPGNENISAFRPIADDTIVLGADVSHPSGGMAFSPSVAAVVGNDDENFANFPGSMRLQAGTQEMITELEDMVYERLTRFYDHRGFLPKRMIFYRDGVSEDQFAKCRSDEMPQIEKAYRRAKDDFSPNERDLNLNPTFIVVGKRHHTRFFAMQENQTYQDIKNGQKTHVELSQEKKDFRGRPIFDNDNQKVMEKVKLNGNLKPGLIVDEVITRPPIDNDTTFDFFLQSHAALKGTARSAHYTVLSRGTFTTDQIQQLTHAFCYNYMRATKGVSYAGPAYYADRLCERGNRYLLGYTTGRKVPGLRMTEQEKNADDKKAAAMAFAKKVAEDISATEDWNPRAATMPDRKNPWHPSFDNCMFWL